MTSEQATVLIMNAFSGMLRPAAGAIARPSTLAVDLDPMMRIFADRDRDDFTLSMLECQHDLPAFMAPEAFAYFLPTFMKLVLAHPRQGASLYSALETMFLLEMMPVRGDDWNARFEALMDKPRHDAVDAFFLAYEANMPGDVNLVGLGLARQAVGAVTEGAHDSLPGK